MFDKDLIVVERRWSVVLGLIALAVVSALVIEAFWAPLSAAIFTGLLVFAVSATLNAFLMNWCGRKRTLRVVAGRNGVSVDGRIVALPGQIKRTRFLSMHDGRMLVLSGDYHRPLLVARVDDDDHRELIHAIGHDAASRNERFRGELFTTRWSALVVVTFAALPFVLTRLAPFSVSTILLPLILVPYLYVAFRGVPIEIGTDGILVSRLFRKEWIPFEAVRTIEEHEGGVRFVLADRNVDLRINAKTGVFAKHEALRLRTFLSRAQEALAVHRATIGPRELAATLGRADRSTGEWLEALRNLRDGEATYRAAAVRDDELWRVVEDAGAPEDARAAAAFVLRRTEEASATERLRVAAQTVAAPRLRVALETADEAALVACCAETSPAVETRADR